MKTWCDRHPTAAVTAGLSTLVFMSMMLCVHPIAAAVLITLAVAVAFGFATDRERQRREDCAARAQRANADYLRGLKTTPAPGRDRNPFGLRAGVQSIQLIKPRQPAPWHLVTLLPTEPMHVGRN